MIIFIIYIAGFIIFPIWDAFIGTGVDWNGLQNPPLWLVSLLWPITIIGLLIWFYISSLKKYKKQRIEKQAQKAKLRLELEQETEIAIQKLEKEINIK